MTKSELIREIAQQYNYLNIEQIKIIVDSIFKKLTDSLVEGKRIEIRGFGSFSIRKRNERTAINPKTNKLIEVQSKKAVYFRLGKEFFDKLNASNQNTKEIN